MIADRYYYNKMSEHDKGIYNALYKGILELKPQVQVDGFVDIDSVARIATAMTCDNPHLFYFKQTYIAVRSSALKSVILPQYFYSKQEIPALNKQIEKAVNTIIRQLQLDKVSNEYEKERLVHDLFADRLTYDHEALAAKNDPKRIVTAHSIIGVFLLKKAVCEGIAKATKILLNAANMKCIVATGKASLENTEEGHAWNIVKVNGNPYHLDATWDIANSTKSSICYDYFNLTDKLISIDHRDYHETPKCFTLSENYYTKNGLCFDSLPLLKSHIGRHFTVDQEAFSFKWEGNYSFLRVCDAAVKHSLQAAAFTGFYRSARYRINEGQRTCCIELAERH